MKKYKRLVLLLIAFISVILMLIYRYRYYNLQSIIDVMNFFPAKKSSSECFTKQFSYNMTVERTLSSNHWKELFDGIYIYSSHVMKPCVFFLAYSKGATAVDLASVTCHLWFENEANNFESKLIVHYLNERNSSHFYFECCSTSDLATPDAVTFRKDDVSITVPVFHKQLYTGQNAACLNISLDHFSDLNSIIEFFIYHSHIGIKHFLVYYTAFSSSVKEVIVNIANECGTVIEFLPWITPSHYEPSHTKLPPYFIDCMLHISSLNHSSFVFLLQLNEFVILDETQSLQKLVYDSTFDYIAMEQKMFCMEYPSDIIAQELNFTFKTLLKTKVSALPSQEKNVIYNVKHLMSDKSQINNSFKTWLLNNKQLYKTSSTSANIYSYLNCGSQNYSNISEVEDKKMWSFKQVLFDSCMYKHAISILGNEI